MQTRQRLILLATLAMLLATAAVAQQLSYPVTKTVDQKDDYFGTTIPDPYRWLENDTSAETGAWVAAQNVVTNAWFEKIPFRAALRARLDSLYNYPKLSAPFHKGNDYFFYKNDGLQNQSVLYSQVGLGGTPSVLLDPNTFSADGTTRLVSFSLSIDGATAAYAISRSGSDWQEICTMDMATRMILPDTLKWVKVSGIAWAGAGFYYSRYDAPAPGKELSSRNVNHKVYYHRVNTPQSADRLVFEDAKHPQRFHIAGTSEDERYVFLSVSERGMGKKGNAIWYQRTDDTSRTFTPMVGEIGDDSYTVIDTDGSGFIVRTDHEAPNGKVMRFDPTRPAAEQWTTIIPERTEPLQIVSAAGGKLFLSYLKDVTTRCYVHSRTGALENEIELPGLGNAGGFGGEKGDAFVFYSFTSFTFPPTIYRYDIGSKKSSLFTAPAIPGYRPEDYVVEEVFYPSKDGTKIPMFLVYKKGLERNGANPTLLYGYGGFNVTNSPGFSSLRLALLEQGFIYASANLRGGGEYGEEWHKAGMKLKKQNVFDDFIAAAEWLIANKYTSSEHLAIQGGSNGGLLVGAVLNQRPELFRAAVPQVGVMDMLRFHKFTIGWNWIPDYGSADNVVDFSNLYAYSPLHNIKEGVAYPATLITTSDHDDRVVPAHSFKYAATLQAKSAGTAPHLIRIETKSGHGASSVTKSIELTADVFAFIMTNLGVTPRY
jgi:prolyl oligopeptidase